MERLNEKNCSCHIPKENMSRHTFVKFQTMVDILSALLLIRRYVDWKLYQEKPSRDNQNTTEQPWKFLYHIKRRKEQFIWYYLTKLKFLHIPFIFVRGFTPITSGVQESSESFETYALFWMILKHNWYIHKNLKHNRTLVL